MTFVYMFSMWHNIDYDSLNNNQNELLDSAFNLSVGIFYPADVSIFGTTIYHF